MGCGAAKGEKGAQPAPTAAKAPAPAVQQTNEHPKGAARFQKGSRFQINLDGSWHDYEKDEDARLKRAFLVGHKKIGYTYRHTDYEYDFEKCTQKNLGTGKERQIRPPDGMTQPESPLLPDGPMVVIAVQKGQAGKTIEIAHPNEAGKKLEVNVPSGAKVGQKMAVPVPKKGETVEAVQGRQKGHSSKVKVAKAAAIIGVIGGAAVGGVLLADHLMGTDHSGTATSAATDAGETVADTAVDTTETVTEAAQDVIDWVGDAADDVGDFITNLF